MKNIYTFLFAYLITLITPLTSVMADAMKVPVIFESLCAPREELVTQLKATHDETHKVIGITSNNLVFEIFQTEDGTTWTAVINRPDGISCMIFAGEDLEILTKELKKKGSEM